MSPAVKKVSIKKNTLFDLVDSIEFLESVLDHFIKVETTSINQAIKYTHSIDEITKLRDIKNSILNNIKTMKKLNNDYLTLLRDYL